MFKQLASKQWTHIASYATCIWCQLLRNLLVSIHCLSQNNRFPYNWHQNNEHILHHMEPVVDASCFEICYFQYSVYHKIIDFHSTGIKTMNTDCIICNLYIDAGCLEICYFQYIVYHTILDFQAIGIKTLTKYCIIWNLCLMPVAWNS
jgi:hypothetical protein